VAGPDSWKLWVQWDGVTETDETASLRAGDEVVIRRGRGSLADDIQPSSLEGVFDNTSGRLTPDNPLSPLWPRLNSGEPRTRFEVAIAGVASSTRIRGRLTLGTPVWPRGQASEARVPFTAVGKLGELTRGDLRCDWLELQRSIARSSTVDCWPFDEVVDARTSSLQNLTGAGPGRLIRAQSGAGTASSEAPAGIDLETSIVLTPRNGIGPVVRLDTTLAAGDVYAIVIPFRTKDRTAAGGAAKYVAVGYAADGTREFSLRLVDNGGACDLNLYDSADAFVATLYAGFAAVGEADGDDQWFTLRLLRVAPGSSTNVYLVRVADDAILSSLNVLSAVIDADSVKTVVLGGLPSGLSSPGKQTACVAARYGAVILAGDPASSTTEYLTPGSRTGLTARFIELADYGQWTPSVGIVPDRIVSRRSLAGMKPFDVLAELARTTGTTMTESTFANDLIALGKSWAATHALTLQVELDVDGSNGLPARKGGTPSQVKATWPGGSVTYTDPTRPLVSKSVETCAGDAQGARDVASALVNGARRLRLSSIRIDIAGSADPAALWTALKDLAPGSRVRLTIGNAGTPLVTQWGATYLDVYFVGWEEHYAEGVAYWIVDTEPADDPPQGVVGSTSIRACAAPGAMTVAPGTLSGTAGLGTIVVTTVSGPTLSTDASDYPADFNVGGERMTVSSAPGSSTSPQTLTVTARGVAPSVGKVHAAGEPFDVWLRAAATW